MRGLDHACNAVDLVAAPENAAIGIVEHCVFMEDISDRYAPTGGVDLTEHVVEIAQQ